MGRVGYAACCGERGERDGGAVLGVGWGGADGGGCGPVWVVCEWVDVSGVCCAACPTSWVDWFVLILEIGFADERLQGTGIGGVDQESAECDGICEEDSWALFSRLYSGAMNSCDSSLGDAEPTVMQHVGARSTSGTLAYGILVSRRWKRLCWRCHRLTRLEGTRSSSSSSIG